MVKKGGNDNMNPILLAVIIVSAIGLIGGLVLAIASIVMAVPKDEKAEKIEECLPGANCGACGFSGCSGYAKALSEGKAESTSLCAPGGAEVAAKVAKVMGVANESVKPMTAVVLCQGNNQNTGSKMLYNGIDSCKAANLIFAGQNKCSYGCLGFGDCQKACPYSAITICDGVARVNPIACKACKVCIATCPKGIIELRPVEQAYAGVFCKNKDKGAIARKACNTACIGCMKCTKVCEYDAITVKDNCAYIDYNKCAACGKCVAECPDHAIVLVKELAKNVQ